MTPRLTRKQSNGEGTAPKAREREHNQQIINRKYDSKAKTQREKMKHIISNNHNLIFNQNTSLSGEVLPMQIFDLKYQ